MLAPLSACAYQHFSISGWRQASPPGSKSHGINITTPGSISVTVMWNRGSDRAEAMHRLYGRDSRKQKLCFRCMETRYGSRPASLVRWIYCTGEGPANNCASYSCRKISPFSLQNIFSLFSFNTRTPQQASRFQSDHHLYPWPYIAIKEFER